VIKRFLPISNQIKNLVMQLQHLSNHQRKAMANHLCKPCQENRHESQNL